MEDGVHYEENECARSTDDHNSYFLFWKNEMMQEKGYSSCECHYD